MVKRPPNTKPEELSGLIPTLLLMERWCAETRALIMAQIEAGADIPGASMMVNETYRRVWEDMDSVELRKEVQAAVKRAGKKSTLDVVAPRHVLSVAQCETVIGKKAFAEDPIAEKVDKQVSKSIRLVLDETKVKS